MSALVTCGIIQHWQIDFSVLNNNLDIIWADGVYILITCRSSGTLFYSVPRFVTHIDDQAIQALTEYYSEVLPPSNTPGVAILDMCSSWVGFLLVTTSVLTTSVLMCHYYEVSYVLYPHYAGEPLSSQLQTGEDRGDGYE